MRHNRLIMILVAIIFLACSCPNTINSITQDNETKITTKQINNAIITKDQSPKQYCESIELMPDAIAWDKCMFTIKKESNEIVEYYEVYLVSNGWDITKLENPTQSVMKITAKKEGKEAIIVISKISDGCTVAMMVK